MNIFRGFGHDTRGCYLFPLPCFRETHLSPLTLNTTTDARSFVNILLHVQVLDGLSRDEDASTGVQDDGEGLSPHDTSVLHPGD